MLFRRVCGIDLGTDTIKICDKNEKLSINEKNMIAIRDKKHVIAVGYKAYEMYEKAPMSVEASSPMMNGSIADAGNLEIVLSELLKRFAAFYCKHPDILITAPADLSEVEKRAFYKILSGTIRAKRVALVEKGVADAIGIGMPMDIPSGNMIVNIGASTTEISVLSEGNIIIGKVLKLGGKNLDEAIATMVYRQFHLHIGSKSAELLKNTLAYLEHGSNQELEVFGIHTVSGLPRSAKIPALAVSVSIVEAVDQIVEAVKSTMERTPPQLLEDIRKNGIYLTGGVTVLPNLADYAGKELDVPVYNVINPAFSTIQGLIQIMNHSELRKLTYSLKDFAGNII